MSKKEIAHHNPQHPTILWDVTTYCNYKCIYCYSDHMPNRLLRMSDRYCLDDIAQAFTEYLPGWNINYSGGEPFVFQDFTELNVKLTLTNKIGIYTNLSIYQQVNRFANEVSPERVAFIVSGFHAAERVEKDPTFTEFSRLYHLLHERGFPIVVRYIVHPTIAWRVERDIERLADLDIKVYLTVFRGIFEGASYPEAFDPQILSLCQKYELGMHRGHSVVSQMTAEGSLCKAGMIYLEMDVEGNAYRCATDRSLRRNCLGNLFKGTLSLNSGPVLCRNEVCFSCRQGMAFTVSNLREFHSPSV